MFKFSKKGKTNIMKPFYKGGTMILVFILLGMIILVFSLIFIIVNSSLKIEIKNFLASNIPLKKNTHYNIIVSLQLWGFLKWLQVTLNKQKIEKLIKGPIAQKELKKLEIDFHLKDLKTLKKLQPQLSYFNLNAEIGLENAVITAYSVAALASIISLLLPHLAKSINEQKYQYHITPIFENKNLYKIGLNCIIELKMVHIINVIYIFSKKGRSDKNERATSNRKSYGYSNEQLAKHDRC